jgi:D-glycero-D-manno-heptose 1,7-bisphosphate phosphatase
MMKLIILDRDGVINFDSEHYIKSPEEWKPLPGSLEAIALLNQNGFRVAVATNQSGVGRGLFDMQTLNAMHDKMHRLVSAQGGHVDAVFFCPHTPEEGCDCRKPKAGMFTAIAQRFSVDLQTVYAVGDSARDIVAAASVGCLPVLVRTGKGEKTFANGDLPENTLVFDNLLAAAQALVLASE